MRSPLPDWRALQKRRTPLNDSLCGIADWRQVTTAGFDCDFPSLESNSAFGDRNRNLVGNGQVRLKVYCRALRATLNFVLAH
jgi:hypothetical protein